MVLNVYLNVKTLMYIWILELKVLNDYIKYNRNIACILGHTSTSAAEGLQHHAFAEDDSQCIFEYWNWKY